MELRSQPPMRAVAELESSSTGKLAHAECAMAPVKSAEDQAKEDVPPVNQDWSR